MTFKAMLMISSDSVQALPGAHGRRPNDPIDILVVFVGHTECRYLRWLKQDFKHCFAALYIDGRWIICDSLKNSIEFSLVKLPQNLSLSEFYRSRGYTVMIGHTCHYKSGSAAMPEIFTCVAVVKWIIGLRSFWTLTPWQLFRRLSSMKDQWRLAE